MLTVAKVTAGAGAGYAAYLEGKAQSTERGDYYLKDGERVEAPGRWAGGAGTVGCDPQAAVSGEQLRALMAVRRPDTGLPLRRVGGNGEAVCAIDATFSAPKSLSAVWALASPELRQGIERAHEKAVARALAYARQRIPMVRRRLDQQTVIRAMPSELIATSWRHTTARAVDGRPPDPQLHSHVLLHGAVRADGKIVAIDSRAWFVHRRELGAAYRTELAHELTQLGFQVERGTGRGGRYFELQGVPAALLDRWSSRHHEVQHAIEGRLQEKEADLRAQLAANGPDAHAAVARLDALRRMGRLTPEEERYMASCTRAPKGALATHGDLDRRWWQTAQGFGLDGANVEQLRRSPRPLQPAADHELLQRLTEFDATFAQRDARAVALEASAGSRIEDALGGLERLRAGGELLALADGRASTRQHRTSERQTVAIADRLAAGHLAPLPAASVERQALALDSELRAHGGELSPEQHHALSLACSEHQLVVIEGQAGTGKSTTLTGIARAHEAEGRQIIVTSTGALAAERLAAELQTAGVSATPYSTVALHAALQSGRLTLAPQSTVIHDEAALGSTREQHRLFIAIEASGGRLIEVGDPRQSHAVGAGGLWPHLEQAVRENDAHLELTRIVRAKNPADRRDQQLFRAGEHEQALTGYAVCGRVILDADQRRAEDGALDAAQTDRDAGKRTLIVAQTSNEHLDELNARAQAIRAQHDELGDRGLPVQGRPYRLHAGDEIQIRHPLDHPQLGRVPNGTSGLVLDINPDHQKAALQLADGREAEFTTDQVDQGSIRLAYVQHPFPAQGQTSDTAHLIVSEHATQEGSYVALTRARETTHIHASHRQLETCGGEDPIVALAEQMGRSEPELPSIATPLARRQNLVGEPARGSKLATSQNGRPARRTLSAARRVRAST